MTAFDTLEVWFITGSQHLYGPEALAQVAQHSEEIAAGLDAATTIPVRVVYKPVLTTADEIRQLALAANHDDNCIGVIAWMHTFSPAKNWIAGLTVLNKPMAHLHTQYNRDIPWSEIDMDFMNLNQAAHGDREFGFMVSRLRMSRKVIVGHWQNPAVQGDIGAWARVAVGWREMQNLKVARIGDNMRYVAVTEGDKVEAQVRFGWEVNGYGIGDLVDYISDVSDTDLHALIDEYADTYTMSADLQKGGDRHDNVREAARIELGLRAFLDSGGFKAFSDTFEDLHGMEQLPGLAVQRLMADGYGFGGEGDWKTAALTRVMKVMAQGVDGGTSFMEDYTYHMDPDNQLVLGAHMLEICPSIAAGKPSLEVHPLGIGGKADPARLVFDAEAGPAINAALMDMGNRFRLVINAVESVEPVESLPKLPVARALWVPQPNFRDGIAAWIYAGGAHHTVFSHALNSGHMADLADMAGIECLIIDENTTIHGFKNELRWNDASYLLNSKGY
ncbi:MAG: L-arabinose isomerase [Chloroflexota bacterium]